MQKRCGRCSKRGELKAQHRANRFEFEDDGETADVDAVMREIAEAIKEEQERLARIADAESDVT